MSKRVAPNALFYAHQHHLAIAVKRHAPTLLLSALILALLTWYFWPEPQPIPPTSPAPSVPAHPLASTSAPQTKIQTPNSKISSAPTERSHLADTLNSPPTTIQSDLRVLSEVLATFRTNFPRDGNPVGTNAEITATLAGQNKLRLAVIPPDHPAISRTTGELLDRWGTPFFFHSESGTRMTITSAGPDKKLHTSDDETFAP